jgi:DNA (cytosine-5)-methyltransferase 1
MMSRGRTFTAAEFFAGIGLVRRALADAGIDVVFANDIEPFKRDVYAANFDCEHFLCDDVRRVRGVDVPDVDLATASFPCTDLSLAGYRAGLGGAESSMFWEFARVLREMGPERRPRAVLLENVPSFATSNGGEDFRVAIAELNALGYICDAFVVNALHFVPQSRPRLFVVGSRERLADAGSWDDTELRPAWIRRFVARNPALRMQALDLTVPPKVTSSLADVVERLDRRDQRWWNGDRIERFTASLSPLQSERLKQLRESEQLTWATAYRRTRSGRAVWEIRADKVSGCLRTARGGSSRQALVEAGRGALRLRWMTGREYARLQGAPDYEIGSVTENQALFGFGDAVCVPVVSWIARNYVQPLLIGELSEKLAAVA